MTQYKFYREPGKVIYAEPERWRWVANYTDGTQLFQFDDKEGMYHQFREIEQERLLSFMMRHENWGVLGIPPISIPWKEGRKLIHFYSTTVAYTVGARNHIGKRKEYCFGYEEEGHKVILHILPDDSIEVRGE